MKTLLVPVETIFGLVKTWLGILVRRVTYPSSKLCFKILLRFSLPVVKKLCTSKFSKLLRSEFIPVGVAAGALITSDYYSEKTSSSVCEGSIFEITLLVGEDFWGVNPNDEG
jgi:hypothetical protein